jgi:23S rRNA (adenine2503-C2)-methyltransferase
MRLLKINRKNYKGKVYNITCTPDHIFSTSGVFVHNCGAGDHFVRSLTADEIVSQPIKLLEEVENYYDTKPNDIERLQIMFMSMGEPLLNLKNMILSLRILYNLYPKAKLLISTIGPKVDYTPLIEISKEIPNIGLQFSVHESTDESRNKLIPIKGKLSLKEISIQGNLWALSTGRQPFFNYCAHQNNISDDDADRIKELFDPKIWQATISVICERDENISAANERQRDLAKTFQNKLNDRGFAIRMFDPAGQDDIGGGCGMLWYVQEWFKNNPDLVKLSVGHGLPKLHTPR